MNMAWNNLLILLLYGLMPFSSALQRTVYTDALTEFINEARINRYVRQVPYYTNFSTKFSKKDNHKPVIDNCKTNAVVNEEQPAGTHVFTVSAKDEDNDTIEYKFHQKSNHRNYFTINNVTGEVKTNFQFDRDDVPSRQKEMYITVLVSDNGRPSLSDVCTFKITILDINDNEPLFDKTNYTESIPQDLAVKSEVMRIYATDSDDGKNSEIEYLLDESNEYLQYFELDKMNGIITLKKQIPPGLVGSVIQINAYAKDHGNPPRTSSPIKLSIEIVDSSKKAPAFTVMPHEPIYLFENYDDFTSPIATLEAVSNMPNSPTVAFHLVSGRTESTNHQNKKTFRLSTEPDNKAHIILNAPLDFETITEYTLTVKITNDDKLSTDTKVIIRIKDVNDNIPSFIEVASDDGTSGSVSENEPPNTPVMQVQATDKDGTSPNNKVTYELADHTDSFTIDSNTGEIRTIIEFDREKTEFYTIKVKAKDGAPSALLKNGQPNEAEQVFQILIGDKNDNPPKFTKSVYSVSHIDESTDTNKRIIEVKAIDVDSASDINYEIIEGNINNTFAIDKTGKITVQHKLDYEKIQSYELKVMAHDFKYNDTCIVKISIRNENDELPIFTSFNKNVTVLEESLNDGQCLMTVKAIDPDKKPTESQDIVYTISDPSGDSNTFLAIDQTGCVRLIKTLDRDPPKGRVTWQGFVTATDEGGGPGSQAYTESFNIILIDINDNAPFLTKTYAIWHENQMPNEKSIINFIPYTQDYDDDQINGPPYSYSIAMNASESIKSKFEIRNADGLYALVQFDREEQKQYIVQINITDSGKPPNWAVRDFTVVIGDVNDNPMKPGSSEIFVNKREHMPDTRIGRVYVEDLDDWDLDDKTFELNTQEHSDKFHLNPDNGDLTILSVTDPGIYDLSFTVTEESILIPFHKVEAYVKVHVKYIPDEAIFKSGSIRLLNITAEDFVTEIQNGKNRKDLVQEQIAKLINVSYENVDIVSILHSPIHKNKLLDIRYSVHASPYRYPEELNTLTTIKQNQLSFVESIFMVNIAECLDESVCPGYSCTNYLNVSDNPYIVSTNQSSYVGVSAIVEPKCECKRVPKGGYCLNGGELIENDRCNCDPGFAGQHCESVSVSFSGNGYALYPSLETCNRSELELEVITRQDNALIFYVGPLTRNDKFPVKDFMSLEIKDGYPLLLIDYGSGTAYVKHNLTKINDGEVHTIFITFTTENVQLKVDNCHTSDCASNAYHDIPGTSKALNVNGPLQLGGTIVDLKLLSSQLEWTHTPSTINFIGCISNFSYNGEKYDLGFPRYGQFYSRECNNIGPTAAAVGIDSNFVVAVGVCIAILAILLLAVVVHKRKHDHWNEKELDDIRETIINYEDEGGGEVDTGFDLELLRRENQFDDPYIKQKDYGRSPEDVPDINGFLKDKKDACDKDPDFNPFDDVRYYAYEGDGNTSRSSLSSLASCTDEGDLKFNYLSNFGPRFRKLADMYGEDPSDEDDNDGGEESWC